MFAQKHHKNILPFPQYRYEQNNKSDSFRYRNSAINTLPEDILQLVWSNSGNGMCITDSDGIIVAVNSAFCSVIHKSELELIGKEFTVLYSPIVDFNQLRNLYLHSMNVENFQKKYEKGFLLHDDTLVHFEITKTELFDDAEERFFLTEYRDITERKRWQRNVQDSELNYRSMFEDAVVAMYQSSIEGKFINANRSMLKLLGYSSLSELRSINFYSELYVDENEREEVVVLMRKNGKIEGKELQFMKSDGSIIHVLLYSRAVTDDLGTITGFEGTLVDITVSKKNIFKKY